MWVNPIYHADARFYPMSIHNRYVVDKVALGQVNLRVLRLPPVSTTPTVLHTHRHLQVTFTRQKNGLYFDVWLTVHLSIILEINQLNAQNFLL